MPFGIQPIHIVIIIVVAFLLFGATKLPEMGRSLGKTISEFKKGTKEAAEGFKEEVINQIMARQNLRKLLPGNRPTGCSSGKFLHPMRYRQPARSAFLCLLRGETRRETCLTFREKREFYRRKMAGAWKALPHVFGLFMYAFSLPGQAGPTAHVEINLRKLERWH